MSPTFRNKYDYIFWFSSSNQTIHSYSDRLLGMDVAILKDEEDDKPPHFSFSSFHLNGLKDPIRIWERGLFLWQIFKGASALMYNPNLPHISLNGIRLTEVIENTDVRRIITPQNTYELSPLPGFNEQVPERIANLPDPHKITQAISKSRNSYEVEQLLFQLGHSLDWVNLYSVLDTLKELRGNQWINVQALAGITTIQEKAFTGTANNFGLLGIKARHGNKGWVAPKNIIDLPDAQFTILSLSNAYLELFHGIGPTTKFADYEAQRKKWQRNPQMIIMSIVNSKANPTSYWYYRLCGS